MDRETFRGDQNSLNRLGVNMIILGAVQREDLNSYLLSKHSIQSSLSAFKSPNSMNAGLAD